jgi:peptidyl-tRNA hydrolase, PTH1 family
MEQAEVENIFLIVGLGNPGREYAKNRHNSGFMVVDRLAAQLGVTFGRLEMKALITKCTHQGKRIVLAKPQTFMNNSGRSVRALSRYYKVPLENLFVICDDVDLPFGTLRLRPGGGSAGQKGMKSIQEQLGSEAFPRLRFGVGRPPGQMQAADYVLQDFSRGEAILLPQLLVRAVDAILIYVLEGLDKAMNLYNSSILEDPR